MALTLVRHQRVGELVAPHVSSGVGGLGRPQTGGRGMGWAAILAQEDPRSHPAPRPGGGTALTATG